MKCGETIELKKRLADSLRNNGTLIGLPIVEVSGHNDPAINCNNQHFTFETFLLASFGVDPCGKPALRVKIIDTCDYNTNCDNNADQNPLRNMFAYDSTEKTYAVVLNRSSE